jgi:hypothetical protein
MSQLFHSDPLLQIIFTVKIYIHGFHLVFFCFCRTYVRSIKLLSFEPDIDTTKICIICKYTMMLHFLVDLDTANVSRGEILRPPGESVPQTIVFRYKEIWDILCS